MNTTTRICPRCKRNEIRGNFEYCLACSKQLEKEAKQATAIAGLQRVLRPADAIDVRLISADGHAADMVFVSNVLDLTERIAAATGFRTFRTPAGLPVLRYGGYKSLQDAVKHVLMRLSERIGWEVRYTFSSESK